MKIKLTCASCEGEVVYEKEKPSDDAAAHGRLHREGCEWKKAGGIMSYIAEHGLPLESEVLG